jgi:hypothetical protein
VLTLVHSFDEEPRKIFLNLILCIFSNFKLSSSAHLTKETVSATHYQQWNSIFLLLCFSECFFLFPLLKKNWNSWCPLTLGGSCNLLYSQCPTLSTVAFLSIFTCRKTLYGTTVLIILWN